MKPNDIEHIGDLFRKKLLDFEPDPPKEVWKNLSSNLPKKSLFKQWWFWSASVLFLTVMTVLIWKLSAPDSIPQDVDSVEFIEIDETLTDPEPTVNSALSDSLERVSLDHKTDESSVEKAPISERTVPKNDPTTSLPVSEFEKTEPTTPVDSYFDEAEVLETPESYYNEKLWETILRVVDSEVQEVENSVISVIDTIYTRGPEQQICRGEEAILIAPHGSDFLWSNGATEPSIVVEPEESTTYYVAYLDSIGLQCLGEITVVVTNCSIFIPNAFSPNGDGLNDVFKPQGHGLTQYQLVILSTWGDKVFESQDPEQGWDGSFKGNCAPSGMYLYSLNFVDSQGISHKKYGSVMLID